MRTKRTAPVAIQIALARHDGGLDVSTVPSSRALVGAGSHCDVRIGGAGVARVHLELAVVDGKLLAVAHANEPPPSVSGQPFATRGIGPDDVVDVAGHLVSARIVRIPDAPRAKRGKLVAMSVAIAVVASLPGIVWAALRAPASGGIGPPPSAPVALWDDAKPACAAREHDQALALAARLKAIGELQRERRPFAVGDGVLAVTSLRASAECFARGGRVDLEGATRRDADELAREVQHDYHVHDVRLAHALDIGDDAIALREVRTLRRTVATRSGPWVDWLASVERALDARTTPERPHD